MKPSKKTAETVKAICEDIENGVPASIAAQANGVGESTHYQWQREDPEYSELIARARAVAVKSATRHAKGFDRDGNPIAKDAQWWLERQAKDEFGSKLEVKMVRDDAIRELLTALRERLDSSVFEQVLDAIDSGRSERIQD